MQEQIVFGGRTIAVTLPDATRVVRARLEPAPVPCEGLDESVHNALQEPMGLPPIRELVRPGSRVTVAFDDPTVPSQAAVWQASLRQVLAELERGGVQRSRITLLCAGGLHRKFTRSELAAVVGADLVREFGYRVLCHDAEESSGLSYLGITESGYEVEINRLVTDSDLTVYVGAGGRSGAGEGWRSVCVGLGSYRSIRWLHPAGSEGREAVLSEMGAWVEDNLGRERIFRIETVSTDSGRSHAVWSGRIADVRQAILEEAPTEPRPVFSAPEEKADIVICGVPDWSPWSAYGVTDPILTLISTGLGFLGDAIESAGRPGCSVILATPCPDRWDDPHHPAHREIWDRILPWSLDPDRIMDQYEDDFAHRTDYLHRYRHCHGFHPMHSLLDLSALARRRYAGRVYAAGAEAPYLPEHIGFEPAKTVEDAVSRARSFHGNDAPIALVQTPPIHSRR
jgi:hypothetical protein